MIARLPTLLNLITGRSQSREQKVLRAGSVSGSLVAGRALLCVCLMSCNGRLASDHVTISPINDKSNAMHVQWTTGHKRDK